MHDRTTVALLGIVAAITSTIAFAPQIKKTWTTGGRDLSYSMLCLYVGGVSLWFCYGLAIRASALTLANAVSIVFAGTCLVLKRMKENEPVARDEGARLRIAIDMDETIADSLKEHIRRYNVQFGEHLVPKDLAGKHLEDFAPADRHEAVREILRDESFFEDLEVICGAQEVVRELARQHKVLIVSAAMEVPQSFAAKYRWLRRHFPFISESNIVFCGDKGVINADYLIDDEPRHFADFQGKGIIFSAPHNLDNSRYERVASWQEIRRKFLGCEANRAPELRDLTARRLKVKTRTATLVQLIALALSFCLSAIAQNNNHTSGSKLQGLPRDLEIQLALSALPPHLRDKATVYVLNPDKGFEVARQGSNGFHAFVARIGDDTFRGTWPLTHYRDDILYPISFDDAGAKAQMRVFFDAAEMEAKGTPPEELKKTIQQRYRTHYYKAPERAGVSYMLAPILRTYLDSDHNEDVATANIPHIMHYAPNVSNRDVGGAIPTAEQMDSFVHHGHYPDNSYPYPFVLMQGPHGYVLQFLGATERVTIDKEYDEMLARLCKIKDVWCLPSSH